jgi:hypothetical protein
VWRDAKHTGKVPLPPTRTVHGVAVPSRANGPSTQAQSAGGRVLRGCRRGRLGGHDDAAAHRPRARTWPRPLPRGRQRRDLRCPKPRLARRTRPGWPSGARRQPEVRPPAYPSRIPASHSDPVGDPSVAQAPQRGPVRVRRRATLRFMGDVGGDGQHERSGIRVSPVGLRGTRGVPNAHLTDPKRPHRSGAARPATR